MFKKKEKIEILEDFEEEIIEEATNENAETSEDITTENPKKNKQKKIKEKKVRVKKEIDWGVLLKDKRSIGVAIMILTIVFSAVISPSLDYFKNKDDVFVYLAEIDIEKGVEITSDMISKKSVPRSSVIENLIMAENPVGKYSKSQIFKDDTITIADLSSTMPFKDAFLYTLADGQQAISIAVGELSTSLSAKIKVDDIVKVFAYLDDEEETKTYIASQPKELQYLKVLAVNGEGGIEIDPLVGAVPATITLLVNDLQAQALVGIQRNANIHLSVVSRGSKEKEEYLLQKQQEYFDNLLVADTNNTESPITEENAEQNTEVIDD